MSDLLKTVINPIIERLRVAKIYIRTLEDFWKIYPAKKIVIGSANISQPQWVATDKSSLDILNRDSFARYWQSNSRLAFMAEHVWEHFTEDNAATANVNCFEFLKPGGRLRIAVPDGFHPDPSYIESVRPGGTGDGAKDHKVLYNYKSITEKLLTAGFKVELLEYWDTNGQFHFHEWSSEDGHVRRSKRYDPRNQDGSLTFTSLIVDAIKP